MKKINKILIFVFSIFLFINCVYAENDTLENETLENISTENSTASESDINYDTHLAYGFSADGKYRNKDNNYGVNKKWTINSSNLDNVLDTPYVDASEKIYDYAGILTDEEKTKLKSKIETFISKTKMDMVILTVNLPYSIDSYHETIAADFYDYNDFGIDFENYDGVIIIRNAYENNPFYNMFTFGKAQLYYPYERCDKILDDIYYYISSKNYLNGFTQFINDCDSYYDSGIPSEYKDKYIDEKGYIQEKYVPPYLVMIIVSFVVTLIAMLIMVKKNKMIHKESMAQEYLDKDSLKITNRSDRLAHTHTTHVRISSDSGGSHGGGGGSHSGSSGGGHGGGGGRHG